MFLIPQLADTRASITIPLPNHWIASPRVAVSYSPTIFLSQDVQNTIHGWSSRFLASAIARITAIQNDIVREEMFAQREGEHIDHAALPIARETAS